MASPLQAKQEKIWVLGTFRRGPSVAFSIIEKEICMPGTFRHEPWVAVGIAKRRRVLGTFRHRSHRWRSALSRVRT